MAEQVVGHLDRKSLLYPFQSGFRTNHSCSTAMVKIMDDIRLNFDNGDLTILCLLDFSKAFDRVDHHILCCKLRHYFGFSHRAVNLIKDYLSNRLQRVVVGSNQSGLKDVQSGVPQGSILGPILFCMYVNDLPKICTNVSIHLYADDVQFYLSRPPGLIEDLVCRINEDLSAIYGWSVANRLLLNAAKTQLILISSSSFDTETIPPIFLSDNRLSFVDNITTLGFKLNRNLSCSNHINYIVGRIYGGLRKLWLSQAFTPLETRLKLLKTLIIPLICYAETVYCKLDSVSQNKLQVAFNNSVRYVYGLRRYDHITQYNFLALGCSLLQFLNARKLIFLQNLISTKKPAYLFEKLQFAQSQRTLNLIIPTYQYLNSSRLFFVCTTKLWNALPADIKRINCSKLFKNKILKFLSEQR